MSYQTSQPASFPVVLSSVVHHILGGDDEQKAMLEE